MSKTLLLFALLISSTDVLSQCITDNDIIVNETSIDATTHNLIDGINWFSLEFLKTFNDDIRKNKDARDFFFSPYNIWSALIVIFMGARGTTEQEIRNILQIRDADKLTTWEALRNIRNFDSIKRAHSKNAHYKFANRIYFKEGSIFKNCIKEMLDNDIAFLDFKSNTKESSEIINTWVEKQTQHKIKNFIPPGGIDSLTNMVIANAVYFKEPWLVPIQTRRTYVGRFTLGPKQEIFVPMMTMSGRFLYGKSEELQCYALELPFTEDSLSMTILLPVNRYSGIDIVSRFLTPERLRNLLTDMYPRVVLVSIPKFRLERSFELASVLNKMGLRTLFDPRRADLSGFSSVREFTVESAYHKTFIDINEQGTDVAAANALTNLTNVNLTNSAAFSADYPFIYFIRDSVSNVILFIGIVQKLIE